MDRNHGCWRLSGSIIILTRGPRQLGNSHSSLGHCIKLALVMASASFLPHEKISIKRKVLEDRKFE